MTSCHVPLSVACLLALGCGSEPPPGNSSTAATTTDTPGSNEDSSTGPSATAESSAGSTGGAPAGSCNGEPETPVGGCYVREFAELEANSVALGDFDADGHLDLATQTNGGTGVVLVSGEGTGVFSNPRTLTVTDDNEILGDVLQFKDLATLDMAAADILFLQGATASARQLWWSAGTPSEVSIFEHNVFGSFELLFGDLDGDGDQDLVLEYNDFVFGALCDGSTCAEINPQQPQDLGGGPVLHDLSALDVDGDGLADLVTVDHDGSNLHVWWWKNEGQGRFAPTAVDAGPIQHEGQNLPLSADRTVAQWAFPDLDGDGLEDLVLFDKSPGLPVSSVPQVTAWRRTAEGGFEVLGNTLDVEDTLSLTTADLDGDGVDEVLHLDKESLGIWGLSASGVLDTLGRIAFEDTVFRTAETNTFAVGDIDEDGALDMALPMERADGGRGVLLLRTAVGS